MPRRGVSHFLLGMIAALELNAAEQQAYVKASNTDARDAFGISAAISGDTLVIGAFGEASQATGVNGDQSNNDAQEAGAAYVFVRDANGAWSQQAYLKASNTGIDDRFGFSVAASGDTIVVGAYREDSDSGGVNGDEGNNDARNAGAAYVFVRDGDGNWSQQAYLKASNSGINDHFGVSVAISGDTIVVGAEREASGATGVDGDQDNDDAPGAGAVYVFVRDEGGVWSQQAYLKASNTGENDRFGYSVAISGDTLVSGAYFESSSAEGVNGDQDNDDANFSGAAYVFVRDGEGAWGQQAYLKASNTGEDDNFGYAVALSDDTIVVGAWAEDSDAKGIDGDQNNDDASDSGAAYVFVRDGDGAWSQQAYLKASNTDPNDNFGTAVGVSGDVVIVGAAGEASRAQGIDGDQDNNDAPVAGAAYVFVRSAETWSQQHYVKASNAETGDLFGISAAAADETVVVGAFREASAATGIDGNQNDNNAFQSGAAYVFVGFGPAARGDMNCDGSVDFNDIDPFVTALVSQEDYESQYPDCNWLNGDIDENRSVDFNDIDGFVECLIEGGCP
jgi:hypothetical protein